jgi:hypothetical protein
VELVSAESEVTHLFVYFLYKITRIHDQQANNPECSKAI